MTLRFPSLCIALLLTCIVAPPSAEATVLAPTIAGPSATGTGVHADFRSIEMEWQGSSVYWNETQKLYSNEPGEGYAPISTYSWGTGLWGLTDWESVQSGAVPLTGSWQGTLGAIDHGNGVYLDKWSVLWGEVSLLPGGIGPENWTAHYSGYLRITEDDTYNFGVLYDDGFFLRIHGAGDTSVEMSSDFLSSRERLGFDDDLSLSIGLYRFELGAYNRLEAGVVSLAWRQGEGGWSKVPTEHLVVRIPLPGTLSMLAFGAAALVVRRPRPHR